VEYAWKKITKIGGVSPKTYFIWNGWNPSGMTWIPHGFHVECGGRVKTSIFDSRNLHDVAHNINVPNVDNVSQATTIKLN